MKEAMDSPLLGLKMSSRAAKHSGRAAHIPYLTCATSCMAFVIVCFVCRGAASSFWNTKSGKFVLQSKADFHNLFLTFPDNNTASEHLKILTEQPHVAGSAADRKVTEYVKQKFEEYGLSKTYFADFEVLLTYPISRSLSLLSHNRTELSLHEAAFKDDPFSGNPNIIETFHGYSPSGDVTGEVVYANYGSAEDFEKLAELNVNVTGAITLVRYGKINRANKVENSASSGAIGVLVYSDPKDYAHSLKEGVYPHAKWLPPSGVQRGSIASFRGDPLTPSWPSVKGAERLPVDDPTVQLPPIPSLPISYGDAYPIFSGLTGKFAPEEWWGALNLSEYRIGRGPAKVRLKLEMNNTVMEIRNVHALIEGEEEPDRYVLLGNHHDAWTFGAVDPNSGTTALLQVAAALGRLLEEGWRPRRTVVLCSWDAEEQALIGSSEWVEDNEEMLVSRAIAYINVDVGVSAPGTLFAGATPQLDPLIRKIAAKVEDPWREGQSLLDTWTSCFNETVGMETRARVGRVGGAGSDYAAFLSHIGVASIDLGIHAEDGSGYPVYHSAFDNFHWAQTFGDPGFQFHAAIAKVFGLLALNLADELLLPFDYGNYAEQLKVYVAALDSQLKAENGSEKVSTEALHSAVEYFEDSAAAGEREAQKLRKELEKYRSSDVPRSIERKLRELNDRLMLTERAFVSPEGIRGRPWFRHLVYAPAAGNFYGTAAFPAVADALAVAKKGSSNSDSWKEVQHEIFRVSRAITKAGRVLSGELK